VASVEIVDYDPRWPADFVEVATRLRAALGEGAARIDHIGSTAVPGLASKDVIDVQVSVAADADLESAGRALDGAGWVLNVGIHGDHDVPGLPPDQRKVFLTEPAGIRRVNVHVRVAGHANQRYPLVVRDYLRAHPGSAQAYATLKRDLARIFPNDSGRYADTKDASCDLIYFAAEEWARSTAWQPGPSDA
jgi:GrpB-like predicted nucleotidyltransferase (UPF0157 family)